MLNRAGKYLSGCFGSSNFFFCLTFIWCMRIGSKQIRQVWLEKQWLGFSDSMFYHATPSRVDWICWFSAVLQEMNQVLRFSLVIIERLSAMVRWLVFSQIISRIPSFHCYIWRFKFTSSVLFSEKFLSPALPGFSPWPSHQKATFNLSSVNSIYSRTFPWRVFQGW